MESMMKATTYAKELRAKLKQLQARKPILVANHKKKVAAWRKALTKWVLENAERRVNAITNLERYERYGNFFDGAPKPPKEPDFKQIHDIQHLLRHLGITGQQTVKVSTADVARLLGDSGVDDDSHED